MREISLEAPLVEAGSVTFRWREESPSGLYVSDSFTLELGAQAGLAEVPDDLWWTVAMMCLHPHWALLRPCRVHLPVTLAPGEREFWLRMIDAVVQTLELTWDGDALERSVEIAESGAEMRPAAHPGGSRPALAFSGGKDSLTHIGLLREMGERPLAVTSTSPMWPLSDHASPRRRTAIEAVSALEPVTHVEVRSDYRACWDNSFANRRGYGVSVNELSDTQLYTSAALVAGWLHGAPDVLLASEAELSVTTTRSGITVQHPHCAYSSAMQRALGNLLARRGVRHGALTYPLRSWQVRRLLWDRYPDLRELQYSCWRHEEGKGACSACRDCLTIAVTALRSGVPPSRVGVDLRRLVEEVGDWQPDLAGGELPDARVKRELYGSTVRDLAAIRTRRLASTLARREPRQLARRGSIHALRRYAYLRGRLAPLAASVPAPGYRHGFLELVDEPRRAPLERIYDEAFERAPESEYGDDIERSRALTAWISEPLT